MRFWLPALSNAARAHPEHGRVLQAYLTGDGERMLSRAHALVEAIERGACSETSRKASGRGSWPCSATAPTRWSGKDGQVDSR